MKKAKDDSDSVTIRVTLSRQSLEVLEFLAREGIFGRSPTTVAARFIDAALQQYVEVPKITLDNGRTDSSGKA